VAVGIAPSRVTWWVIALASLLGTGLAVLAATVHPALAIVPALLTAALVGWGVRQAERDPASPAALEALKVAERHSTIVAAASHEIRNPLTMIAASIRLLQDGTTPLDEQQGKFASIVQQQSDQAISIADDLLIQARIDAGKFSINPTPTDLVKLVREVVDGMRPIANHRGQTLIVDVPQYMPVVPIDPRAVRQALANLLMNAVRHTAEGRMITTRVRDNTSAIVLMVVDDGDGMSKDERRRLFEPFESGDLLGDGTGLGLNITRQLVEAHGGRILIDTRLREGTSIMITLPKGA
jgi:two-component system OmpR family sensor kinase